MRRAARPRPLFPVIVVTSAAILAGGIPAFAALQPGRPPLGDGTPRSYTPVMGEAEFVCGTYKGNESQHAVQRALHLRNQRDVRQGRRVLTATALDYVYNDVWIIEDDGSLTFSGTNAFDTNAQTHQYASGGGGVYTVSSIAYTFNATVGTLISPGDDGAVLVAMQFAFPFAGGSYQQIYVSGNGAVSFGAVLNPNGYYDDGDFFSTTPKIAAYYLDLNPAAGGSVRVISEPTKYTVTWSAVPEYGTASLNTVQLVLFSSGNFTVTYNGIASTTQSNGSPIVNGFHPGGADPPLEEISFSAGLPHVSAAGASVYEQYYSYANPLVDEVALFNRFYTQFPDDFFQLIFFTTFTQTMGGFANERNIANDVTGIGLGIFDGSSQYGSNGVLESRCNMNRLSAWNADPALRVFGKGNNFLTIMGQEAGHRWGAFMTFEDALSQPSLLMLGRDNAHWSYYVDVDHSSLEGGNWVNTGGNNYLCPTQIDYFSQIDEYTFGLRTANEVKDFFIIQSASNDVYGNRAVGTPLQNATATGTYTPVTVEDVIAAEGPRTPLEPDENHDLRQGFIFLVQQGGVPTQADLDKIAGFRTAWETYFEKSCDGRVTLNTSLTQDFDPAVVCGFVQDALTQEIIPEFTAHSLERGFDQHVPDDGRYIFRYLESATSGTNEDATLVFEATGYYADTIQVSPAYGTTTKRNVFLVPIYTGAGEVALPTELHANHPNPFNPSTTISYRLGEAGRVRLTIYDAAGRHVRTLADRAEAAGEHAVVFDGRDDAGRALASGVYFYRLDAGDVTRTRKMVLLK
jgi:hypothetical protein